VEQPNHVIVRCVNKVKDNVGKTQQEKGYVRFAILEVINKGKNIMKKSSSGYAYIDTETGKWKWAQQIRRKWQTFSYIQRLTRETIANEFLMIGPLVQDLFTKVVVSETLHNEILYDFIPRWKKAKLRESRFQMDNDQMVNRAMAGFLGEAAIETLFGIPVLDRDKDGKLSVKSSYSFKTADLSASGLDVGVKTVEWGKFPVIKRTVRRPQMISFKVGSRTFLVGGYASMKVLRDFQSSIYILNEALRNKRKNDGQLEKVCFYGFHKLVQIHDLDTLRSSYYKKGK